MDGTRAEALLDAAPVGLMVVDGVGTITWVSPSVYDLTGYGYEDVVGTNIVNYLHETAVQGMVDSISYIQEYTDAVMGPTSMAFVHADGALRVLEIYAVNRFDHPEIEGLVVAVRDQTFQYGMNTALQGYTEGNGLDGALKAACTALLGMPVRGRAAVVDPEHGLPLTTVALPDAVFGPAPSGGPPRPWQQSVTTGRAVFAEDLATFDDELRAVLAAEGLATMWAVPIADPGRSQAIAVDGGAAESELRACLIVARVESGPSSVNERYTVAYAMRTIGLMMEREHLVAEIDRSARTDALTGLANRAHLFRSRSPKEPTAGRRGEGPVAVLYLDLDGFKPVNDRLGHAAGDAVLVEVADRMRSACREGDELGRIGGDEFVLLCWDVVDEAEAVAVAERILASIAPAITVPGATGDEVVTVGTSIGIALSPRVVNTGPDGDRPDEPPERDGETLDAVLRRADAALYDAKRAGKNCWRLASGRDSD